MFFGFPWCWGTSEWINICPPANFPSSPRNPSVSQPLSFSFLSPYRWLFFFLISFFFLFCPSPLASTNSDPIPPGLLLTLDMFALYLAFALSPSSCFSSAPFTLLCCPSLPACTRPDRVEFEWEWWVGGSRRGRIESFWESIVSIKFFCLIFHLAVVLVSTSTHSRV